MAMTEDEYIRYLVYLWKKSHPDGLVPYLIDDGCNCLHRTYFEHDLVIQTTSRCHCRLVYVVAFEQAGMRWVENQRGNYTDEKWKARQERTVGSA